MSRLSPILTLSIALAVSACGSAGSDAPVDGTVPFPHKRIFVTSTVHDGALGGVSAADAICAARAEEAGLPGTFRAWLSVDGDAARDRLVPSSDPYVRTDGVVVAADWNDLLDGTLLAPIARDEIGLSVGGDVWTGTLTDGTTAPTHCDGFTSTATTGLCGSSTQTGFQWTANSAPLCDLALHLFCLEQ